MSLFRSISAVPPADLTCSEIMECSMDSEVELLAPPKQQAQHTTSRSVPDYDEEQLASLLETERESRANPRYLWQVQGDQVKEWMRDLVVQWVLETGEDFRLHSETIAMAVNIFDRFLSKKVVAKQYLQLVATAAILISSKALEVAIPALDDLSASSMSTFTIDQIKLMEVEVLNTLGWSVTGVTSHTLVRTILATLEPELRDSVRRSAAFFTDLTFCAYSFLQYSPSVLASAAIMCGFRKQNVSDDICHEHLYTRGIDVEQAVQCRDAILELYVKLFPAKAQEVLRRSPVSTLECVP